MRSAIIVHGSYGTPKDNWFPWLKDELKNLGYEVFIPKFPTPINQNLENWLKVFEHYKNFLDNETILIGHSLGVAFILSILERINSPIKACFLISGFVDKLSIQKFDEVNQTFTQKEFDWNKIRNNWIISFS